MLLKCNTPLKIYGFRKRKVHLLNLNALIAHHTPTCMLYAKFELFVV